MRSCLVGFSIAFVLACAAIGCQPYPTPTPQPPAPIVVPDVVPSPSPVGPRVSFVLDAGGKVVDAPAIIQACETPGTFTVYSNDSPPVSVVVGDDSPVPPSPVPPQPPVPTPIPSPKIPNGPETTALYVYEKDQGSALPAVMAGLNRLNRDNKIGAYTHEEDTTDGEGDVPEKYKAAMKAARETGLPALVITVRGEVVKVVKDPQTVEDVTGAIQ